MPRVVYACRALATAKLMIHFVPDQDVRSSIVDRRSHRTKTAQRAPGSSPFINFVTASI
jgi:hypothetical protein